MTGGVESKRIAQVGMRGEVALGWCRENGQGPPVRPNGAVQTISLILDHARRVRSALISNSPPPSLYEGRGSLNPLLVGEVGSTVDHPSFDFPLRLP